MGILSFQSSVSGSDDLYGTHGRFERLVKAIQDWQTTEENKQRMFDFLRRIDVEGIGIVQKVKYCDSFRTFIVAIGNKNFQDVTEQDMERFLEVMQVYKPATKHLRWVCVKKFMRYQGKEDVFRNIQPRFSSLNNKLPEELLTPAEVDDMVNAVGSTLEKCLLYVKYKSRIKAFLR